MAYLLDANCFIHAKNLYYGFDVCPGFWDWLEIAAQEGNVLSIDAVYDEIVPGGDELSGWVRAHPTMFLPSTSSVLAELGNVNQWAQTSTRYTAGAKTDFAGNADSRLVAFGAADGHRIVTHELPGLNKKNTIKIPDAAAAHNVKCVQLHNVLRSLGAKFVLPPGRVAQGRLL